MLLKVIIEICGAKNVFSTYFGCKNMSYLYCYNLEGNFEQRNI